VPTVAELKSAFDKVKGSQVVAYVDNSATGALMEKAPTAGRVTATAQHPTIGVTEWTLSNGARVLVKTTDFQADQVILQAWSPGGSSLAADSLIVPASFSPAVVQLSGVGRFSMVDLNRALAGKAARVAPNVADLSEGMSGSASPKDLETLLQLVHLHFTEPRRDTAAFQAALQRIESQLRNRSAAPQAVFEDTMSATLSRYSPRQPLPTPDLVKRIDLDRALAFYRDRFGDASDFTFVFVGNVTADQLRPLAEKYLATLPAAGRKEKWVDRGIRPPDGVVEKVVKKGQEPKALTRILFHGPAVVTAPERVAFNAMREVLDIRLREVLREDKGGTYGVQVGGTITALPEPRYSLVLQFGAAPERLEELTQATWGVIDSLRKADITPDELTKTREIQRRARETSVKQNAWWVGRLLGALQEGRPLDSFLGEEKLIESTTPAMIRAAAQKYLDRSRYVRGSLYPDNWQPATGAK
jgi:zinc protease